MDQHLRPHGRLRTVDTAGGRLLRATSVAVITVGLSALGHAAAGSRLPSVAGMLLTIALATAASYPLCRFSVSRLALVPLLALVQGALHPLFTMAADPPWDHPVAGGASVHEHAAGAGSVTMLAHHLAAALVAAGVVLFTDRVIADLVADRRLFPVATVPTIEPVGPLVLPAAPVIRCHGRLSDLVDRAPRRGPPAAVRNG